MRERHVTSNKRPSEPLLSMGVRYLVILGLLTVLCTVSYKFIGKTNDRLETASSQIMLISRESVLSQRVANLSNRLVYEKDKPVAENARDEIKNALDSMEKSHRQLIEGNENTGFSAKSSLAIAETLFDSPFRLDSGVNAYISRVRKLAAAPDDKLTPANPDFEYVQAAAGSLQGGFGELLNQYRNESRWYMKRLVYLEAGVFIASISILVLMGLFVFYPIVKRIRTEMDKLRETEEYTREILQTAADGVISVDEQGNITSFNRAAERMFGYSASEASKKNIWSLISAPGAVRETGKRLKSGEKTASHRDGGTFPVDLSVNDTHVNGRLVYICVVRDITERKSAEEAVIQARDNLESKVKERTSELTKTNALLKQEIVERESAQEALRESERRFRTMADTVPVMIWMAGSDNLNSYFNKMWLEFRGRTQELEAGNGWTEGIHPEDRHRVIEIRNEAFRNQREFSIEYRLKKADGGYQMVLDHGAPRILNDGSFAGYVGCAIDITDRQKDEEENSRSRNLDLLGQLAAKIAHGYNNVLTSITSNTSLAKEYVKEGDPLMERLVDIEKAAGEAAGLTKSLLTFSIGGAPLKENMSVEEFIRDAARSEAPDGPYRVRLSLSESLWRVDADCTQMSQAVAGIVKNARESMSGGGEITIAAENVKIKNRTGGAGGTDRFVKISVRDTGSGISRENLKKIFDPYFTTKDGANGLGLTAAYSIVKNHGGFLTVDSDTGSGTTIYIYLPASDTAARAPETRAKSGVNSEAGCERRVLVMDDEKIIREAAGKALRYMGYRAEFAEDGERAIDIYNRARKKGGRFDAVLLDLTIPGGMGGEETVKKLLEIDPGVRAIATSGYSENSVMSDFRRYGFVAAVSKPYTLDDLKKVLNSVVRVH